MAIFPKTGQEYYDETDKYIKQRMESFYTEHSTNNLSFVGEADVDTRMYCGDQTVWNDMYGTTIAARKKQFMFNRIRRVVDMVSGYQRRNRKSIAIVPRENGDQQTADQLTKVLMWSFDRDQTLHTVSDAFLSAMITGMSMLQVWMDYQSDPISGNLRVDSCPYNSFIVDTYFKKQDLSDCTGLWKRSFVTRAEALSLLPSREEEIAGLSGYTNQDGKFQFMPEYYGYDQKNMLTYDEFYYRAYRTQKMLVDTETGETLEWKGKDENDLREFLALYPTITVIDGEVPTVKLAIVVQGRVLYDGPNPTGTDRYPFVPVLGYFHPELPYYPWRIQGMVRGLRDAQYLYNRRRVIELDILESQINSGIKYKENALVDPRDAFLTGQGRGLAIKEEASMADVETIQPPQVPPSMIQLSELLAQEVNQISGVNEELLGSASDDKAGVLSMLRQGAGLTTLQLLFDQLDNSQKILGSLCVEMVQANFTPGKVARIIDTEASPAFNHKAFGTYDAVVEDGFNTSTQRQMQFAQMLQLRELGVPITNEDLLRAATLQNKDELIQNMQQQQQQEAQMQQMQVQAALQEQEARTNLANARATADEGLGIERLSRVKENQALAEERHSQSYKDRMSGLLDIVKALKEMDEIDIRQVQQLLTLSEVVRAQEATLETPSTPEVPVVDRGSNLAARVSGEGQVPSVGMSALEGMGPAVSI